MRMLEKVIKDAIAADKYRSGTKEVFQSIKGSRLIIVSKSLNSNDRTRLKEQAKSANVVIYEFPGNSVQLGKLCNKPFRITAIAVKSGAVDEINAIMSENEGSRTSSKK